MRPVPKELCPHCRIYYGHRMYWGHRLTCGRLQLGDRFQAMGKTFVEKPTAPSAPEAPPLRLISLTLDGKNHPLFIEDALTFKDNGWIVRNGSYRAGRVTIFCYLTVTQDEIALARVMGAIGRAQRAVSAL